MAFLSSVCFGCFGSHRKAAHKKAGGGSGSSRFGKGLTQEALLGITIEELGSLGKGGRPASKAPLTSAAASGLNGKGYNEVDMQKNSFTAPAEVSVPPRSHVKETTRVVRYEDSEGNKVINDYVRDRKIGTGSYGKVVLHRKSEDNVLYAIKIFHKSRLRKLRVAPAETAMMDVLREVAIMKRLDHPNIVKLVEVIDDPESDHFYMVLEYVEGQWIFEGSGPPGGIGDALARRYLQDVVAGLSYLHKNNVVHGDIKPENLLISGEGRVKICDFGVSQTFTDDNDELRRTPGTPVYTAPECCQDVFVRVKPAYFGSKLKAGVSCSTYHGRAADIWALGCTLYCMVLGRYPYVGSNLQTTYEKVDQIVNEDFWYPEDMDPKLLDLLKRLLCKDPKQRLNLVALAQHPWVTAGDPSPVTSSV